MTNEFIDVLNSAFQADPNAIYSLIVNKVPCNRILADHPHVIVGKPNVEGDFFQVGPLGLINGLLTSIGELPIGIVFGDQDEKGCRKIVGFRAVKDNETSY